MRKRTRGMGANLLLGMAVLMLSLMMSSLGVDIGVYLDVQNELQTAANAGALAGAAQLPLGESQAVSAAQRLSTQNRVGGALLSQEQLHITTSSNTVEVVAHSTVTPTIMSGFCQHFGQWFTDNNQQNCLALPVAAHAKAVPAARDTVLVIDASSSMSSLGNNRPLRDVQAAAKLFADMVANQPTQTSDRIALVTFHQTGTLQQRLTSEQESPNFTVIKQRIDGIRLFSGTGWNTNYHAGLKVALDELAQNGRPNAEKRVVFMTDGMPNLPAPANYYTYNRNEPYRRCTDPVHNSQPVRNLCYRDSRNRLICPTLPSSQITNAMISSTAQECGQTYVNSTVNMTNAETDRAHQMGVTIDTIEISDGNPSDDHAISVLRRLIKNPTWFPTQLAYMTGTTKGQTYAALNYDATAIARIYETAAKQIRVKLSQ